MKRFGMILWLCVACGGGGTDGPAKASADCSAVKPCIRAAERLCFCCEIDADLSCSDADDVCQIAKNAQADATDSQCRDVSTLDCRDIEVWIGRDCVPRY